jgi:hypothetical protein
MSYSFNGATDVLTSSSTVPINTSFTTVCWVNLTDATPASAVTSMCLGTSTTAGDQCRMGVAATGFGQAVCSGGSTNTVTNTAVPFVDATWRLQIAQFTINASNTVIQMDVYTGSTSSISAVTSSGAIVQVLSPVLSGTVLGARFSSTGVYANNMVGKVAHAAIYNKLLSPTERVALRTSSPNLVAPTDLIAYWPLLTDLTAYVGADMTASGAATLNSGDGPGIATSASSIGPAAAFYQMLRSN